VSFIIVFGTEFVLYVIGRVREGANVGIRQSQVQQQQQQQQQ